MSEENEVVVEGRFGEVRVLPSKALFFPQGILGFEEAKGFALTEFSSPKMNEHFRLLQSLDNASLSFITLPVGIDNSIIEEADILKISEEIGVSAEHILITLIASPAKVDGMMRVSVNAKAPIIIDAENRLACQYVFSHDKYAMKHDISAMFARKNVA